MRTSDSFCFDILIVFSLFIYHVGFKSAIVMNVLGLNVVGSIVLLFIKFIYFGACNHHRHLINSWSVASELIRWYSLLQNDYDI